MPDEAPVRTDSALWRTWQAYRQSELYTNNARWAQQPEHTEGSLWAAFVAGFHAATDNPLSP